MKYLIKISLLLLWSFVFSSPAFAGKFDPLTIVNAVSMGASITSDVVDLKDTQDFSISEVSTGSPVGSILVQVSNAIVDTAADIPSNSWSDYTGTAHAITTADNFMWNFTNQNMKWLRVVYTRTSGAGTLTVVYGRKI